MSTVGQAIEPATPPAPTAALRAANISPLACVECMNRTCRSHCEPSLVRISYHSIPQVSYSGVWKD